MAELEHRSRNLLSVVQAIAMQTVRRSTSLAEFEREFVRRVEALARVQAVIGNADDRTVDLRELVAAELQAHYDEQLQSGGHGSTGQQCRSRPRPRRRSAWRCTSLRPTR